MCARPCVMSVCECVMRVLTRDGPSARPSHGCGRSLSRTWCWETRGLQRSKAGQHGGAHSPAARHVDAGTQAQRPPTTHVEKARILIGPSTNTHANTQHRWEHAPRLPSRPARMHLLQPLPLHRARLRPARLRRLWRQQRSPRPQILSRKQLQSRLPSRPYLSTDLHPAPHTARKNIQDHLSPKQAGQYRPLLARERRQLQTLQLYSPRLLRSRMTRRFSPR